jgi:uncharacterized membrane protein
VPPTDATRTIIVVVSICAAIVLWFLLATLLKGGRAFQDALVVWALPFFPFLSLLVVYLLYLAAAPWSIALSIHAVIFSAAAFIAIATAITALRRRDDIERVEGRIERRALWLVMGLVVLYWLTFSCLGALQYYSLNISYTDTADWEQMLWNAMRGRFLRTSAFEHTFLGEHVQFVHLFLLPFYALFPSLITLMVLKSAALASGAFPVYLLARDKLGSKAAGACFAAAYLLYPAMQFVDLELAPNTFRPVAFAIPALLWAVYFLEKERMLPFCVAAFFALASKEEMALPVAMMGLVLLTRRRRLWGAGIFVVCAIWFLVSVLWVIPHFRGDESHMWRYYEDFGKDLNFGRLIWRIVSNPLHTLSVAFGPVKIDYLLLLLVPLGLRPLFSRRMLVVMLPSLATTLLASREGSGTIYYHYQASLVPLMTMGAVYGAAYCVPLAGRVISSVSSAGERERRRAALVAVTVLVAASALFGNVLFAQSPISLLFHNSGMQTFWRIRYLPTERSRVFFREIRPLVPADASVSATEFLATYFAAREVNYAFPDDKGKVKYMEYMVVDREDRWSQRRLEKAGTTLEQVLSHPGYEMVYEKTGFAVYRRVDTTASLDGLAGGV